MDRYRSKKSKEKSTNRIRQNFKKETFHPRRQQLKKILKKAKKEPLASTDLILLLRKRNNFIGCFPSDRLKTIYILAQPVFFIVNIDVSCEPGSHWIAVRIGNSTVEIFDSLGFNTRLWNSYPSDLFLFLNRYRISHKFFVTPILQPPNTFYCGLYCVYFIIYRQNISFKNCVDKFSRALLNNNSKLASFLIHKN